MYLVPILFTTWVGLSISFLIFLPLLTNPWNRVHTRLNIDLLQPLQLGWIAIFTLLYVSRLLPRIGILDI